MSHKYMDCPICNHVHRADIENAILNLSSDRPELTIEKIAEVYDVSAIDLKEHAMFHTPLGSITGDLLSSPCATALDTEDDGVPLESMSGAGRDSLAKRMKLREADMLMAVANEYLTTLQCVGRRIHVFAQPTRYETETGEVDMKLSKMLTKPIADMYIGLGGEIRATVKTVADIDQLLNGPKDSGSAGLSALVTALRSSRGADEQ